MSDIIFDFDGTIADSLPVVMKLFYKWSKREPFTKDEIETLRNMGLKDVLKAVGVPMWRAPSLLSQARRDFTKHVGEIEIFYGMSDIIAELHSRGHKLYLMSSNSPHNIRKFLKLHKIDSYFSGIHGNTGLFSKAGAMRTIAKKYNFDKKNSYAIGDETRDIEAAKKSGLISIAVNWGYNGTDILNKHKPDHLVSKPAELLKLIK